MLNKNQVLDLVLALADVYGKEMTPSRVKLYVEATYDWLKKEDSGQAYKIITKNCEYFPTPKQIIDLFDPVASAPDRAALFVDQIISGFIGPEREFAGVGRENYYLAKDILGLDRWAFQSGRVDPKFMRKQWIESMTEFYIRKDRSDMDMLEAREKLELEGKRK